MFRKQQANQSIDENDEAISRAANTLSFVVKSHRKYDNDPSNVSLIVGKYGVGYYIAVLLHVPDGPTEIVSLIPCGNYEMFFTTLEISLERILSAAVGKCMKLNWNTNELQRLFQMQQEDLVR